MPMPKKPKLDPDCTEKVEDPEEYEEDEDHMSTTDEDEDEDEYECDMSEDDDDDDDEEELLSNRPNITYWSPRMELFSVRVKLNDGESLGKLLGAIRVMDSRNFEDVFHPQTGVSYESIAHPGWPQLLLTGPNRPLRADDCSCLVMKLTNDETDLKFNSNMYWKVRIEWQGIFWDNMRGNSTFNANQPLNRCFDTKFGKVLMEYAMLSCAMGAIVQVVFVKKNDGNNADDAMANVYGTITARTTDLKGCERVLFRRTHLEAVKVKPGDLIPLTRTCVSGTFGSRLVVRLDLWNHNDIPCVDNDEIVVSTRSMSEKIDEDEDHSVIPCSNSSEVIVSARFRSEKIRQKHSTEEKLFPGSVGDIHVNFDWTPY